MRQEGRRGPNSEARWKAHNKEPRVERIDLLGHVSQSPRTLMLGECEAKENVLLSTDVLPMYFMAVSILL